VEVLRLRDGRDLEVYVSGPADAPPFVLHHGVPGNAVPLPPLESAAHATGLRYVTFTRPGYGHSTRLPGRSVADSWRDVADLLDWLGAERCVMAGWSGGGPHALAATAALPDRTAACLLIGSVAQFAAEDMDWFEGVAEQNDQSTRLILAGEEPALRELLKGYADPSYFVDVDSFMNVWPSMLPGRDRRALRSPLGMALAQNMGDAVRESIDGWMDDLFAMFGDWKFFPERVERPELLWQGGSDLIVPRNHWEWLHNHLPTAVPRILMEEGHFSLIADHSEQMVSELAMALERD
jgi:pimeloyl-ACP methyl ester carboxylesterase